MCELPSLFTTSHAERYQTRKGARDWSSVSLEGLVRSGAGAEAQRARRRPPLSAAGDDAHGARHLHAPDGRGGAGRRRNRRGRSRRLLGGAQGPAGATVRLASGGLGLVGRGRGRIDVGVSGRPPTVHVRTPGLHDRGVVHELVPEVDDLRSDLGDVRLVLGGRRRGRGQLGTDAVARVAGPRVEQQGHAGHGEGDEGDGRQPRGHAGDGRLGRGLLRGRGLGAHSGTPWRYQ